VLNRLRSRSAANFLRIRFAPGTIGAGNANLISSWLFQSGSIPRGPRATSGSADEYHGSSACARAFSSRRRVGDNRASRNLENGPKQIQQRLAQRHVNDPYVHRARAHGYTAPGGLQAIESRIAKDSRAPGTPWRSRSRARGWAQAACGARRAGRTRRRSRSSGNCADTRSYRCSRRFPRRNSAPTAPRDALDVASSTL